MLRAYICTKNPVLHSSNLAWSLAWQAEAQSGKLDFLTIGGEFVVH